MTDFSFASLTGGDDETTELKKLNEEVLEDPDNFEHWEKLVRAAESLEGGLNRNSNPQYIAATRDAYDRFLAKFPLLFGYWKKYAELEFSIAGTEAAEMVYERGVASITNSVDLWTNYCGFKLETSHEPEIIRELFERGANYVGLDFLAHPFWDKYIEFEERHESFDKIFDILQRVVHIPMHQYARYFEKYRQLAQSRPIEQLASAEKLQQIRQQLEVEGFKPERGEQDVQREVRTRVDNYHLEIFSQTQAETTKRWTFESEVKRPYFHVTELDEPQLENWRKYLDFEESEGDYLRTTFLYERCLVTCAYYDEFWFRYARWMSAQKDKEEEVRNIYQRASFLYAAIARPEIRLQYALFEESTGRIAVAEDIYQAILVNLLGHVETVVAWAYLQLRQHGLDSAIEVYNRQIESDLTDVNSKGALLGEWAKLIYRVKGSSDDARQVFQQNQQWYLHSSSFWTKYLAFELEQPTSAELEPAQAERIKQVHTDIRTKSQLPVETVRELTHTYMKYLQERGTKDAAKEYITLDREVDGPLSVRTLKPAKPVEIKDPAAIKQAVENGQTAPPTDDAFAKFYQQ